MEVPVVEDTLSTFDEELGYYPELPVTGDETVLKDDEEYYFPPVWDEYASANNISSNDESFDGDPFEGAMEAPEGEGAMEAPEGEGAMEAPEGEGAGNEGLEDVVWYFGVRRWLLSSFFSVDVRKYECDDDVSSLFYFIQHK